MTKLGLEKKSRYSRNPDNRGLTVLCYNDPSYMTYIKIQTCLDDILKFKCLIYKTGVQAFSQDLKSGHQKCAIGPAQMNNFLR